MTANLHDLQRLSGHEDAAHRILLEGAVLIPVDMRSAAERVGRIWPDSLGPAPNVEPASVDDLYASAEEMLVELSRDGESPVRIVVVPGSPTLVRVAGHHGVVDGLGLVRLLAAVVGRPAMSKARGVGEAVERANASHGIRRAVEALLSPASRVEPERHVDEPGEWLVQDVRPPLRANTISVVSAAAEAVRAWNTRFGSTSRNMVVAVAASLLPGVEHELGDHSAWFRVRLDDPSPSGVAEAMRTANPEPLPPAALAKPVVARVARLLASRTSSSFLVSNLGLVTIDGVNSLAIVPWVHGPSAVAIGCTSTATTTTFTLRARRSHFSRDAALRLLRMVADRVG